MPKKDETQKYINDCIQYAREATASHGKLIASSDPAEAITDLLADLMHYAAAEKLDFAEILKIARKNYQQERKATK